MKRLSIIMAGMSVVLLPLIGHAQIYICKDEHGRTVSSDRPLPECSGRTTREMSREGVVKREIPAPLTPEQKRLKQIEDDQRKAELAAQEEKRNFDRLLVARYPTEAHIEIIRQRALSALHEKIRIANAGIVSAGRQQKELEADSVKRTRGKLSSDARMKWDAAAIAIENERINIREYEVQITQTNSKFDTAVKRYREISGPVDVTAVPAPQAPGKPAFPPQ